MPVTAPALRASLPEIGLAAAGRTARIAAPVAVVPVMWNMKRRHSFHN
jgi:hypothetical protein